MKLPVRIGIMLLSAGLLPLCFPPFGWWPIILAVIFLLIHATNGASSRQAFYLGMVHGMIGYGLAMYWFFNIFGKAAIPFFAIMGLFNGFFCLLYNFLIKQINPVILKVLAVTVLWTAIEFYRSELFFLRLAWITPGAALGPTWLSPIVGVYGTSFVIAAASAAFMFRSTIPIGILLSVAIAGLSMFRPPPIEPDANDCVRVTVVQSEECMLDSYADLTRSARSESPDLVVWPEYSLLYDVRKIRRDFAALTNLCAEMKITLVVGTKTVIGKGERDWHNTALILDETGVVGEYYKARPVHFFNDGIPGHNFNPITTKLGAFATPICFDCDFTEVARRMARNGAEFFAVPSFDEKTWSVTQHLQHSALFRLRAVENGRWLACAASSGISQIIDPHGNIHASLPPMEKGTLTHSIGRNRQLTFFTRIGWLFPWIILVSSVILLAGAGVKARLGHER